jgi:hypothetical protein
MMQNTFHNHSNSHDYILWLLPAAFAAHVFEEYTLGFIPIMQTIAAPHGIVLSWQDFFVVNIVVLVWGICSAAIGWRLPVFSLTFPGMMIINAVVHIVSSFIIGKPSPGVITGTVLYIPLSIWVYRAARADMILKKNSLYFIFGLTILFHLFAAGLILLRANNIF